LSLVEGSRVQGSRAEETSLLRSPISASARSSRLAMVRTSRRFLAVRTRFVIN
jgi:hypothetical protein